MIQVKRDYLDAYTYERVNRPRGLFFQIDWNVKDGEVTVNHY